MDLNTKSTILQKGKFPNNRINRCTCSKDVALYKKIFISKTINPSKDLSTYIVHRYKRTPPNYVWIPKQCKNPVLEGIRDTRLEISFVKSSPLPKDFGSKLDEDQAQTDKLLTPVRSILKYGLKYPTNYCTNTKVADHKKKPEVKFIADLVKYKAEDQKEKKRLRQNRLYDAGLIEFKDDLKTVNLKSRKFKSKQIHDQVLSTMLKDFLEAGIISRAPKYIKAMRRPLCKLFCVKNTDGSARMIVHPKQLNRALRPYASAVTSPPSEIIRGIIENNPRYLCKIDLKKGFYNLRIDRNHRSWFTFYWKGKLHWWNNAVMGVSDLPIRFQHVVREVLVLPTANETKVLGIGNYLDDIIIWDDSQQRIIKTIEGIKKRAERYNIQINFNKSTLYPVKEANVLGRIINTETGTIAIPDNIMEKFCGMMKIFPRPLNNIFGMLSYCATFMNTVIGAIYLIAYKCKNSIPPCIMERILVKCHSYIIRPNAKKIKYNKAITRGECFNLLNMMLNDESVTFLLELERFQRYLRKTTVICKHFMRHIIRPNTKNFKMVLRTITGLPQYVAEDVLPVTDKSCVGYFTANNQQILKRRFVYSKSFEINEMKVQEQLDLIYKSDL